MGASSGRLPTDTPAPRATRHRNEAPPDMRRSPVSRARTRPKHSSLGMRAVVIHSRAVVIHSSPGTRAAVIHSSLGIRGVVIHRRPAPTRRRPRPVAVKSCLLRRRPRLRASRLRNRSRPIRRRAMRFRRRIRLGRTLRHRRRAGRLPRPNTPRHLARRRLLHARTPAASHTTESAMTGVRGPTPTSAERVRIAPTADTDAWNNSPS